MAAYELKQNSNSEAVTSLQSLVGAGDGEGPELVQASIGGHDGTTNNASSSNKRWFELDAVFDKRSSQAEVYERSGAKKAVCEDIFSGFNCTIFAYGQSGAGKSFTMGSAMADIPRVQLLLLLLVTTTTMATWNWTNKRA